MKVSVIIPSFGQATFLPEAIESILTQTYADTEIVVVDDCSTDGSLEVAQSYAQKYSDKIKLVVHAKNQGLCATRNTAISHATGELILPLDADDFIYSNYLEELVPKMVEGVGVVAPWMTMFVYKDLAHTEHIDQLVGDTNSCWPIFAPTKERILKGNTIPICSLVRKQAILDVGGYSTEMSMGAEDWCLWAKIVWQTNYRIEVVPKYLFNYRVHATSMCRSHKIIPFAEYRRKLWSILGVENSEEVKHILASEAPPPHPIIYIPDYITKASVAHQKNRRQKIYGSR